jgi:serine/threonine-protein kinase
MTERQIGPFIIEKQLGAGGMGIVYLATYNKTKQQVALKVLSPDVATDEHLSARFEREIEILKKLKHPNIVRYYGGGIFQTQRYYAMEVVTGGSLEDLLEQEGKLTWDKVIPFAKQICIALQHAHELGVVHRDLKPANLLLGPDGSLKLTDFGIARDNSRTTALTAAGKTVGTYAYMAPEQITGKYPITQKTDLYALGCVIFEMLTGRTPFHSDAAAQTLFKHIDEPPPRVRDSSLDCPIWLDRLVENLLSKEPTDRPYDAYAVQVALDDVLKKVEERTNLETIAKKNTKAGGATVMGTKVLGAKKKKKKKGDVDADLPIYERTWFLATAIAVLVGLGIWWSMPLGEEALFKKGNELYASNDAADKTHAREKYFEPLVQKYPDGKYAKQAQEYIDEMEMELKARQIESRMKRGAESKSEGERLYRDAQRYLEFGDRLTAMDKLQSLITLMKDQAEEKSVINLARKELAELKSSANQTSDRATYLTQMLKDADDLYNKGQTAVAKLKWESIESLYAGNQEFVAHVNQAKARLAGDFSQSLKVAPVPPKTLTPPNE